MLKPLLFPLLFVICFASGLSAQENAGRLQIQKRSGGRFFAGRDARGVGKFGLLGLRILNYTEARSYLNLLRDILRADPKELYPKTRRAVYATDRYLGKYLKRESVYSIVPGGRKDFGGRTLLALKLSNHKVLNLEMVRRGFAYPRWNELDQKQQVKFRKALELALKKKRGLWPIWAALRIREKELAQKKRLPYEKQKKITLMTYNVENLFDTEDSPDTKDHSYLPLAQKQSRKHRQFCRSLSRHRKQECLQLDWSPQRLKTKMERLAKVILRVNQGRGPDVLFLQEIENYSILRYFRDTYLSVARYHITHFESRDRRGIDVAILSRLRSAAFPEYHEIDFDHRIRTRGILHTRLLLPDSKLMHILVFHLPSQRAPQKVRQQALYFLALLKKSLPQNALVVAAGDCNVVTREEKSLYPRYVSPFWKISHYVGCKGCPGTYYYPPKKSWSFFDAFYFSHVLGNKKGEWYIPSGSIRIFNPMPFQKTKEYTPDGYRLSNFSGVSDHWPMLLEIQRTK